MPWLINEDKAVKLKFEGMTVVDASSSDLRDVDVKFRHPQTELSDMLFPSIVIEHDGFHRDTEREHRGNVLFPYAPEGYDTWWPDDAPSYEVGESLYSGEFPIPYNIDYAVTTYSRTRQDSVQLMSNLASPLRIPERGGFLEIPEDGTTRRLGLLGGPYPENSKDAEGKNIFRNSYKIRVSSERPDNIVVEGALVTDVVLQIYAAYGMNS